MCKLDLSNRLDLFGLGRGGTVLLEGGSVMAVVIIGETATSGPLDNREKPEARNPIMLSVSP